MGSFSLLILDGCGATIPMITLFMWKVRLPFCEGESIYAEESAAAGIFLLKQVLLKLCEVSYTGP